MADITNNLGNSTQNFGNAPTSDQAKNAAATPAQASLGLGATADIATYENQIYQSTITSVVQDSPYSDSTNSPFSYSQPKLAKPSSTANLQTGAAALKQLTTSPANMPSMTQMKQTMQTLIASLQQGVNPNTLPDLPDPAPQQVLDYAEQHNQDPRSVLANAQGGVNSSIENALKQLPNTDKTTFAYYDPQSAQPLSEEDQASLANAVNTANTNMGAAMKLGAPLSVPVNSTAFNASLSAAFNTNFAAAVAAMVSAGTITEDQGQQLTTLQNMPKSAAVPTPTMQTLLATINNQVITQMQQQYGATPGWSPEPDTAFYNNVVNGNFLSALKNNVANTPGAAASIPTGQDLADLVEKYMANPNDPSIPEALKGLIAQTIAQIAGKYGLSSSWQPDVSDASGVSLASTNQSLAIVGSAQQMVANASATIDQLPPSPERSSMVNFLKVINAALNTLQKSVFAMEINESKTQQTLNNLSTQIALANIKVQQAAQEAAQKKQQESDGKSASLGPIGDFLKVFTDIVICVFAAVAAPATGGLSLALAVDYCVNGEGSLASKGFNGAVNAAGPAGFVVAAAICGVSFAMNPMIAMCMGPMLFELFSKSNAIPSLVAACGGSPAQQMIATAAITAAVEIIVLIAMMCVGQEEAVVGIAGVAETTAEAVRAAEAVAEATQLVTTATTDLATAETNLTAAMTAVENATLVAASTASDAAAAVASGAPNVAALQGQATAAANALKAAEKIAEEAQDAVKSARAFLAYAKASLAGAQEIEITAIVSRDAAIKAAQLAAVAAGTGTTNSAATGTQTVSAATRTAAKAAEEAAKAAEEAVKAAAKTVSKVTKALNASKAINVTEGLENITAYNFQNGFKLVEAVLGVAVAGMQGASEGVKMVNELLMAEIVMIKARAEAMGAEAQAMIDVLQQLIKALLNLLQNSQVWVKSISTQEGSMYDNAALQGARIGAAAAA